MADRLKGKIAIVVGAGSIGPAGATARRPRSPSRAKAPRCSASTSIRPRPRRPSASSRTRAGRRRRIARMSAAAEVAAMVEACLQTYGRVDVLDNNVGVAAVGGVVEVSEEEWDRVMAINLKSCFLAMKHVIPVMERQGGGSIINISSVARHPLHRRALRDLLRLEVRHEPPDADHGGASTRRSDPRERRPARPDGDADGRDSAGLAAGYPAARRSCGARATAGAHGLRRRCLGRRLGRGLPRQRREPLRHGPRARGRRRHHAEIRVSHTSLRAKRSNPVRRLSLDCFVASLLAMTI